MNYNKEAKSFGGVQKSAKIILGFLTSSLGFLTSSLGCSRIARFFWVSVGFEGLVLYPSAVEETLIEQSIVAKL